MKNKGFTLIELLATMVVLGLLIGIATTNVIGMMARSRNNSYIEDAKKIVSGGKYKAASDTFISEPAVGECVVITLAYIGSEDFKTAPYNGKYLNQSSFVVITKGSDNKLKYYTQLVESFDNNKLRGVKFVDSSKLKVEDATTLINNFTASSYIKLKYGQTSFSFPGVGCSKATLYTDNSSD